MPVDFLSRKSLLSVVYFNALRQINGDSYVLESYFVNIIGNFYSKISLNVAAKNMAPTCVAQANERTKCEQKSLSTPNFLSSVLGRMQYTRRS